MLPEWVNNLTTKDKILETARMLFMKEGLEGVRMQMVADEAGVNKGLLHYYYKSKDKLFTAVFNKVTSDLLKSIGDIFDNEEVSLEEKIDYAVDAYFSFLSKNPRIPVFFIFEINRDSGILKRLGFGDKVKGLIESASHAFPNEKDPDFIFHFVFTLVSLSVFPFMVKPLLKEITGSEEKATTFLDSRRSIVKTTLKNMAIS